MNLLDNPFFTLKANTKDNKARLISLEEEFLLNEASSKGTEARLTLTNQRRRLSAEIAWLPGVNNELVKKYIQLALEGKKIGRLKNKWKILPLAFANIICSLIGDQNSYEEGKYLCCLLISTFEEFDIKEIQSIINQERKLANFHQINDIYEFEQAIDDRRKFYIERLGAFFNSLEITLYASTLTLILKDNFPTDQREPLLISDLVNSYEVTSQHVMCQESEKVSLLVKQVDNCLENDLDAYEIEKVVNSLILQVNKWNELAHLIQLSKRRRGLDDIQSNNLALEVRCLAASCLNSNRTKLAYHIILSLQKIFFDVPYIYELLQQDLKSIQEVNNKGKSDLVVIAAIPIVLLITGLIYALLSQNPSQQIKNQSISNTSSELFPYKSKYDYEMPSISEVNSYSKSQLRWCIREKISLDDLKNRIISADKKKLYKKLDLNRVLRCQIKEVDKSLKSLASTEVRSELELIRESTDIRLRLMK